MSKIIGEALTFDDVLLVPQKSSVLPRETCLKTNLTHNITLNVPFLSAAMDTVTESKMAIAMAQEGGMGIIHSNMSIDMQRKEIEKVKESPINESTRGLACVDINARLRVGAAICVDEAFLERVDELVKAQIDAIVIDSAHGHSVKVIEVARKIKNKYPNLDVIAGNIVTKDAALDLINVGVDCLKVGIGAGSICTTRIVAGVGIPQLTAILNVYEVCKDSNICIIADGGIRFSGDIVKAIAAGADSVMIGNLLAGAHESPSKEIIHNGGRFKSYVGMGSLSAMQRGSLSRYFHGNAKKTLKLTPEGVEGMVTCKGTVQDILFSLKGGLMSGMGYLGTPTIPDLKANAQFVKITNSSLTESHPHDILIPK
ncbi:guanosine monophosphate reductase (plasmid) [Borrelia turcica IST7]|uniref:Guanosine monophosphate reductase n=1 Tax=Borrelia turcica IST7 TaxID=1104446 RepID=A0A386PNQ3_9SPIR|nr:IMP dehydrogenase [Borrelia turcica]AYE36888.1 guanosine monophosphate reductase [Borrelia turcica IST7]